MNFLKHRNPINVIVAALFVMIAVKAYEQSGLSGVVSLVIWAVAIALVFTVFLRHRLRRN